MIASSVGHDTFASHAGLFIGSFAIGIGASLIALTFKPFGKEETALAPA